MFLSALKRIIAEIVGYKKPVHFGSVGSNVVIGLNCEYSCSENIHLGSNIKIGDYAGLYAQGGITIDDGTILADRVDIRSANHYFDGDDLHLLPFDEKVLIAPVHIEENCWIASHVIILAGVTVGEGSVIGAGSVITRDVPPFSIVAGNPGRVIKSRNIEKYMQLKESGKQYMKEYATLKRVMVSQNDIQKNNLDESL